jgi:hypothetical protein
MKLHESGLITFFISNYLNQLNKHSKKTELNDKTVIGMDNISSVLIVFACISAIAVCFKLIEMIISNKKKRARFLI